MGKLVIRGGKPLKGKIPISGAKNAALPLMAASLLTDQPVTLANMPILADIHSMAALLDQHGVKRKTQQRNSWRADNGFARENYRKYHGTL